MEEVPRRTSLIPLAFPCFLHCLTGVETEGLLDYQGRTGDHFHCTVETSPGHIRCRRKLKFFRGCIPQPENDALIRRAARFSQRNALQGIWRGARVATISSEVVHSICCHVFNELQSKAPGTGPKNGNSQTSQTLTSLNKEVRPFFLGDHSIWSFPSVSSFSDCSIWRS